MNVTINPEDVLDQSDEEYIPPEDASESEDNLEVNSEESDAAVNILIPMKMNSLQNQVENGQVQCP